MSVFSAFLGPMNAAKIYGTGIEFAKNVIDFLNSDVEPGAESIIKMQLELWRKQIEYLLKELKKKEEEEIKRQAAVETKNELKKRKNEESDRIFEESKKAAPKKEQEKKQAAVEAAAAESRKRQGQEQTNPAKRGRSNTIGGRRTRKRKRTRKRRTMHR